MKEMKAENDMVNKRRQRKQQSNEQIDIERESARLRTKGRNQKKTGINCKHGRN